MVSHITKGYSMAKVDGQWWVYYGWECVGKFDTKQEAIDYIVSRTGETPHG